MKVTDFIQSIQTQPEPYDWSQLERIAELTALRKHSEHGYFISNFWRGPLLYSLVRKFRPKVIVELGTGRGYGAMAIAAGVRDENYEARILSLDITPGDKAFDWIYKDDEGNNTSRLSSLNSFWSEELPEELIEKISFRCADTASVHSTLSDIHLQADLVFIDGDHSHLGAALDFFSSHSQSAKNAIFVFDDYSDRPGYGVQRLVDKEISTFYTYEVLEMESEATHDIEVDHRMVVVNPEGAVVDSIFPQPGSTRFRLMTARRFIRSLLVSVARKIRS